ncbi:hypothetical protein [Qipengyuania qiaonensis]|uniref:NAD-dependent epimerase/dehydratase family protein n=1 Tax=Qipengyuania qiaonensis TaxID=2867240 RepID=A0ABS7J7Q0_9SPHN|nr:hypothetical protein [Qipengyuania qiaonensis]MBX7483354.1 hypothetical protein [Qipengyuania qiaonensis]
MSLILVLGGYGGFGGRISRRLSDAGHEVVVAGRSLAREWEEGGVLHFDVPIALPSVRRIVHYRGVLRPA